MDVRCVVDDAVQRSSAFWGEHGVSFLIEAGSRRVLFDTGQSGTVLLHNLTFLDVEASSIDAVAISHAHYDHTGGLPMLLEHLDPDVPLHANPDLFRERYSMRDGESENVGMTVTYEDLATRMSLRLDAEPQEIVPGVWTTGTITERPEGEGNSDYHRMRTGDELVQDAYLDDLALVLELADHLALLCGCCHAGLINTLAHVERTFKRPVKVIAGGLHLTSVSGEELERVCGVLAEGPALERVYPNHCTGEAAFVTLTSQLGASVVQPCPAGTVLVL